MKFTLVRSALGVVAAGAILGSSLSAFAADDGTAMKQADDLLKQAWNPGGDPPAASERIDLLTKAFKLAASEPDHRLHGLRADAMRTIQLAIDGIKSGQSENMIYSELDDADRKLRSAIEIAETH